MSCFHAYCMPCLAALLTQRENIQTSDIPGRDADEEERRPADSLTCTTCRRIIPLPAGGVTVFQTNFYLDSSTTVRQGQPVPCILCDGDQTAQFHCLQCRNSFCPQCRRVHNKLCQGGQVRVLQDPSDRSSSAAQSPSHRQVRQQLQMVEAALKKLAEEERKLNQEREAMDDSSSDRYATLLHLYDGLTEHLHSSMAEARQALDTLQQQLSSSQSVSQHITALSVARDLGIIGLFEHHMEDNTGRIARPDQSSSGPSQSQAPSGSPPVQDDDRAMLSAGADPETLNSLSKKVEDLASQVTSLQTTDTQLSQHVTLPNSAHSELTTEQSALLREMTTLKEQNDQLTTEQAVLQIEMMAMKDKHTIILQDMEVLAAKKVDASAELTKLQKGTVSWQTDASKPTTDIVQLKEDVGDVAKVSSIQSDLKEGSRTSMKKVIEALQRHRTSIRKDINALQKDRTKMKAGIKALKVDRNSIKSDIKGLQTDRTNIKTDIAALQKDGTYLKKDITSLQGDRYRMKKDIKAIPKNKNVNKDIEALRRDVDQLKKDCGELKSVTANIQETLNGLESQLGLQGMPPSQSMVIPEQEPLTASQLAAESPEEQKQMLGERLFPLIQRMVKDQAYKITGMLVELDNSKLLSLLESQESLQAKVKEAVAVLRAHQKAAADANKEK